MLWDKSRDSKASRGNMVAQHLYLSWLNSPVVNGVCMGGGTAGGTGCCEFKSPQWQLFFMGLDWILSD